MKYVVTGARYLLGIGFVVFGFNAFMQFMPPPELPEEGGQFMGLLFGSGGGARDTDERPVGSRLGFRRPVTAIGT